MEGGNFTTDLGVRRIGSISVACEKAKNETIKFTLEFGATEIVALATNEKTGASQRINVAYDL